MKRCQRHTRRLGLAGTLFLLALGSLSCSPSLEHEEQSEFAHIRVRQKNEVRTLAFVQEDGHETIESRIDMARPHELQSSYTRFMFASYLLQPEPTEVLIIGLGGGAMVHFLQHHDPEVGVDAVEIDPAVVRIAQEWFDVRASEKVRLITADAFDFVSASKARYDVIYLDAFLPASVGTDATGVPLRLRTVEFYRDLRGLLRPGGLVVFNVIQHDSFREDVRTIREAFPHLLLFQIPGTRNRVALGATAPPPEAPALAARARELDARFEASFEFEAILESLVRED